jgi:predicted MFS family arabinose efflux permease
MTNTKPFSESWLIFIIGAVQFINVLDFMMVMPMGPDFAIALNIPTHDIGWIGGIYTLAAALSGLIGALFLDNYDRKKVLTFAMCGLLVATLSCALAWNFESLLAARFLAGCFGGPLTSAAIAIIADNIPPERRGSAMGKVMGAFSVASIVGVPFGLEISGVLGWQAPFISLAVIGLGVLIAMVYKLPKQNTYTKHLKPSLRFMMMLSIVKDKTSQASFAYMGLVMMSGFMIIPNISAHLQYNVGYPRDQLGMLYFFGGIVSFFGMRIAGKFIDKYGAMKVVLLATALIIASIFTGFVYYNHGVPVLLIFICFMLAMSTRNVCGQTVSSKVPPPQERGAFNSLQSSLVHISSATGAFISSIILTSDGQNHLVNIEYIGIISMTISFFTPLLMAYILKRLKARVLS